MFALVKEWKLNTKDPVATAKFSPDGIRLAIVQDLNVLIYAVNSKNNDSAGQVDVTPLIQITTSHTSPISDLVWSPDSQCIATASDDYSIEIIHYHYGHLHRLIGHTAPVTNLTYNPRGNLLYSSSMDESIKVWDVLNGTLLKTISAHSETVVSIDISKGDPSILCSGSYDGLIRLFDSQTGHCLKTLTYDKDWKRENEGVIPIIKVEVSFNGKYILVKSLDGIIKIWDCVRGDVIRVFNSQGINSNNGNDNDNNNNGNPSEREEQEGNNTFLKYSTDCRLFYPKNSNTDPLIISGDETGIVYCWKCNKPNESLQVLQDPEKWHKDYPILSIDTNHKLDLICVLSMNGVCSIWKWEGEDSENDDDEMGKEK